MTETFFKPTDDLDPEGIQEMGKKAKAKKKPEDDDEEDSISFQETNGAFDTRARDSREMPKQRRRRPKMGK